MTTTATAIECPPSPKVDRKSLPPGPPELPVIGQAFRYLTNPLGLIQEAAGCGDLVTMSMKPALVYLVNHPDLVWELFVSNHQSVGHGRLTETLCYLLGNGLVTADGPFHLLQRRLMQPQFHRSRRFDGHQPVVAPLPAHTGTASCPRRPVRSDPTDCYAISPSLPVAASEPAPRYSLGSRTARSRCLRLGNPRRGRHPRRRLPPPVAWRQG